jgi:hypothetical protein
MTDDVRTGQARADGIHFVGTIPLADAKEVFSTVCSLVGDRIARLPDGETGPRKDWVGIQVPRLAKHPDIVRAAVDVPGMGELMLARPRDGLDPRELDLGNLGYADFASDSYAVFRELKEAGVIASDVRFQVSLPTPAAIVCITALPEAAADMEAAYERALLRELTKVAALVPAHELAVQWDTAFELMFLEGWRVLPPWFDVRNGVRERMTRLGTAVPEGAELGFHLCYGDYRHQRQVLLDDASALVELANTLAANVPRPIDFMHLPVRGDVNPVAYLEPLDGLRLDTRTELYLGLITDEGGLDGARERITAAHRHLEHFGVATECGLGRRPPEAVLPLLEIHRSVSAPRRFPK